MLVFVPGLVQAMPQPVLAAVVITASISLFDVAELRRLYHVRRTEFALAVACALGVALLGVLQGIVVAVVLSVVYIFKRAWSPYSTVLGSLRACPGTTTCSTTRMPSRCRACSSCAGPRRSSSPTPTSSVTASGRWCRTQTQPPLWVLVAAEPITDIDTTAGSMLVDLDLELNAAGIHLAFAELQTSVRDAIVRYGLLETIDQGHLYPSVTEAVKAFRREVGGGEGAPASSEAPPVSGA